MTRPSTSVIIATSRQRATTLSQCQPNLIWSSYMLVPRLLTKSLVILSPGRLWWLLTHGIGHGIDWRHEEPDLAKLRKKSLTCYGPTDEPGIYIEGNTAFVLEDDILITDNGCELIILLLQKESIIYSQWGNVNFVQRFILIDDNGRWGYHRIRMTTAAVETLLLAQHPMKAKTKLITSPYGVKAWTKNR